VSPSRDRNDRALRALGELVRDATESAESARRGSMPARRSDAARRQALAEAIESERRPASDSAVARLVAALRLVVLGVFSRRGGLALGALVAAALAFVVLRDRKLGYSIDGGADSSGWVRADGHSVALRFEDGSTFSFTNGASGRVGDVGAHGAVVVLEDGSVEVSVVHRTGAEWSALAGPWEVEVTGTRFDLAWNPRERGLRVDLWEGRVVVRGPGAEEGIALHAGQSLEARGADAIHVSSLRTSDARSAPTPGVRPQVSAPGVAAADAPSSASASPVETDARDKGSPPTASADASGSGPSRTDKARASWTELVAKGKHDVVLAEARERGVPTVLGAASSADLLALADAARYGGDSGLASRALHALRDRFAGTKPATDAAFLLGRMADDGGATASAIRFYDQHLAEGGAFSQEALGRKMIAVRRVSGDAAARAVAKQYLDRYPRGPHATIARGLVEGDVGLAPDRAVP